MHRVGLCSVSVLADLIQALSGFQRWFSRMWRSGWRTYHKDSARHEIALYRLGPMSHSGLGGYTGGVECRRLCSTARAWFAVAVILSAVARAALSWMSWAAVDQLAHGALRPDEGYSVLRRVDTGNTIEREIAEPAAEGQGPERRRP